MYGKHVLVVGVELTDCPSLAPQIEQEFSQSREWQVHQSWIRLGQPRVPKFVLINRILAQCRHLHEMDYVIIADDDITLPKNFLDNYLRVVEDKLFALAQPARDYGSPIHHHIVSRVSGLEARRTRFVEIGPLVSIRRDALPLLVPFDTEITPMGWGYDYTWPLALESAGLYMGIVDSVPVGHTFREPVSQYSGASDQMVEYLRLTPHLEPEKAYTTLVEYPVSQ